MQPACKGSPLRRSLRHRTQRAPNRRILRRQHERPLASEDENCKVETITDAQGRSASSSRSPVEGYSRYMSGWLAPRLEKRKCRFCMHSISTSSILGSLDTQQRCGERHRDRRGPFLLHSPPTAEPASVACSYIPLLSGARRWTGKDRDECLKWALGFTTARQSSYPHDLHRWIQSSSRRHPTENFLNNESCFSQGHQRKFSSRPSLKWRSDTTDEARVAVHLAVAHRSVDFVNVCCGPTAEKLALIRAGQSTNRRSVLFHFERGPGGEIW